MLSIIFVPFLFHSFVHTIIHSTPFRHWLLHRTLCGRSLRSHFYLMFMRNVYRKPYIETGNTFAMKEELDFHPPGLIISIVAS